MVKESSNSCSQMVYKIGVFKNYEKFTGKHLCRSLVFNEIADWKICQNLQENTCPRVSFFNKVACKKVYQNSQETSLLEPGF